MRPRMTTLRASQMGLWKVRKVVSEYVSLGLCDLFGLNTVYTAPFDVDDDSFIAFPTIQIYLWMTLPTVVLFSFSMMGG